MDKYRKKDVLKDHEIDAFETIEVNKIKSKLPRRFRFRPRLVISTLSVILVGIVILNSGGNEPGIIGTPSELSFVTDFEPITLKDIPRPLRGLDGDMLSMSNDDAYDGNLKLMSNKIDSNNAFFRRISTANSEFNMFDDQIDVTGEGQITLTEIIENQEMYRMAVEVITNVGMSVPHLTSGVVTLTDEGDQYLYTVNEDGTYTVLVKSIKDDSTEVVEVMNYYLNEELFFEVSVEVIRDDSREMFKIKYNRSNTEKYQYVRKEESDQVAEIYVSVIKDGETTNVVAQHSTNGEVWQVVGNATEDFGVIFMEYTTEDQENHMGVEYYNGEGVLLKQEYGTQSLNDFNNTFEAILDVFEQEIQVEVVNLIDLDAEFNEADTFTVEMSINDASAASVEEVNATLVVGDESYEIDYMYSMLLHTKKSDTFTSGDTIYFISNSELTDTQAIITYKAVYDVPELATGANGMEYYMFNRYMAKYIEPKEGFSIEQRADGQYQLINESKLGEIGDRIDVEIKEVEEFFSEGEIVPVTVFNYTSDIQIENIVFTEQDVVDSAKTNMTELYNQLVPAKEELDLVLNGIDITVFE